MTEIDKSQIKRDKIRERKILNWRKREKGEIQRPKEKNEIIKDLGKNEEAKERNSK